jgi:hypothetical protein
MSDLTFIELITVTNNDSGIFTAENCYINIYEYLYINISEYLYLIFRNCYLFKNYFYY